jgi:hypothetical protein
LAAHSNNFQFVLQKEADTAFFEVAHCLGRARGLANVSEIRSFYTRNFFTESSHAPARWGTRSIQALKKGNIMAVKRHLRGASSKEQRQYEHIKKSAQRSGRYGKRAKQVAARTVMKQHRKKKKSR